MIGWKHDTMQVESNKGGILDVNIKMLIHVFHEECSTPTSVDILMYT